MKTKNLIIILVVLFLSGIFYFSNRKSTDDIVSDLNLKNFKVLTDASVAVISSDTISKMVDAPSCYFGISVTENNILATLWLPQDTGNIESAPNIIYYDSMGLHMFNATLVEKNKTLFEITVAHSVGDNGLADILPGWKHIPGSDIIISNEYNIISEKYPHRTATIHNEETLDSVVLRGYRILREETPRKIVYYEIVGRAVRITDEVENEIKKTKNMFSGNNLKPQEYDSSLINREKSYAIKVPVEFFNSIMGLSGSGVYKFANGEATDELIGVQSNRFVLAEVENENGKTTKVHKINHVWIIFQRVFEDDLQ